MRVPESWLSFTCCDGKHITDGVKRNGNSEKCIIIVKKSQNNIDYLVADSLD
jgi:hypothetical protein